MRVLLVDDHELIWNGTRRLLEEVARQISLPTPLTFRAVRDVLSATGLPEEAFDLILLDYHLPGTMGLAALKEIQVRFETSTVCMLSAETGSDQIRAVLEGGAAGFIPKSYGEAEMASALRLVLGHKIYAPAEFLFAQEIARGREVDEVRTEEMCAFLRNELSSRQRQVLSLALQGLSNKGIARRLLIAEGTVKVHLSMVYRALGVKNRVGALCRVLEADAAGALE
jgi:two-component system nitrate/nitrite response regulator NarL